MVKIEAFQQIKLHTFGFRFHQWIVIIPGQIFIYKRLNRIRAFLQIIISPVTQGADTAPGICCRIFFF
ncbi:hypothetical protein SS31_10230 [Pluralibacter gergoviae]|nr:hypothetical protein SS31_10230 [Pluralibacter gergoviae]